MGRVNAEHAKAMKDLKASVARYVTAIASSRQVRNNAEDSIYHLVPVLVEEAKRGLDESQKHPDDVDSWNKGKQDALGESVDPYIANAKAQYRKNAADADIAKRKARKLRRESAALAKEAMVPAKRSSKEADPALVAHSERVNAEHAKAMKDLKASVARYVTAIASSRQVRNNAEDSIYHLVPVLVEEAKRGLDESQKHPDDVDSWNKGKQDALGESVDPYIANAKAQYRKNAA